MLGSHIYYKKPFPAWHAQISGYDIENSRFLKTSLETLELLLYLNEINICLTLIFFSKASAYGYSKVGCREINQYSSTTKEKASE